MSYASRAWFSPDRGTPYDDLDNNADREDREEGKKEIDRDPVAFVGDMLEHMTGLDEIHELLSWVEDDTIWPAAEKLHWPFQ
jgi:hypothetical protein